LLAAYDSQLRDIAPPRLPKGVTAEADGPLLRFVGYSFGGFITYRDLGGADGSELDDLIVRQVRYFSERGERFEWKLHGHDRPDDLGGRLAGAGFVPDDAEAVMVAPVAKVSARPVLPEGVDLREVSDRPDLERITAMEEEVWLDQRGWLISGLLDEIAADPTGITVIAAEAEGRVVCAGWVRFVAGTEFATLWGGSTLEAWRGRGIYRALVAYRANQAAERGFTYLQVDASPDSRPILERLGFVCVTTTIPYVWTPDSHSTDSH
jgi:GNAT superfamily N-acetyltransferase